MRHAPANGRARSKARPVPGPASITQAFTLKNAHLNGRFSVHSLILQSLFFEIVKSGVNLDFQFGFYFFQNFGIFAQKFF